MNLIGNHKTKMKTLPKNEKIKVRIAEVSRGNYGLHLNFEGYYGTPQLGKSLIEKQAFPRVGDLVTVTIADGYNGSYISEIQN